MRERESWECLPFWSDWENKRIESQRDREKKRPIEKTKELRVRGIERRREGEREKNNKIWYAHATVAVHIFTATVAIVHKCTILPQLMWVFFEQKCVKRLPFSILHKFTESDVIALSSEKHGCFGNFVYFSDLTFFLWLSTSLYNITTVTEHLKRQPTLQAMIQNQISKQWLIFIDLKDRKSVV